MPAPVGSNTYPITIDLWMNLPTITDMGRMGFIYRRYSDAWSSEIEFGINRNGYLCVYSLMTSPIKMPANTWTHVALVCTESKTYIFMDGVIVCERNGSVPLGTGGISAFSDCPGYFDEYRVSYGVARWTSNFIPPTSPYGSISLLKSANAYYSINSEYYDIFAKAYIPLSLSGGTIPNTVDINTYGFHKDDLTKLNTINGETFRPIDKMYSNFEIKEYKVK